MGVIGLNFWFYVTSYLSNFEPYLIFYYYFRLDYDAECPSFLCLGNQTCLIPPSCYYQDFCLTESYYQSSLEMCPSTTECTADQGCDSTNGVCAYCPGDGSQCTVVEGVTSSESCKNLSACELPNGDIQYLSAEDCLTLPGQCSGECAEPICRPLSRYQASACAIYNLINETLCEILTFGTGSIDANRTCVSFEMSQSECDSLTPYFDAEYFICESLNVSRCNNDNMNYIQWNNLSCGISPIGPCQTKESCESVGGFCSDSMWMQSTPVVTLINSTKWRHFSQ